LHEIARNCIKCYKAKDDKIEQLLAAQAEEAQSAATEAAKANDTISQLRAEIETSHAAAEREIGAKIHLIIIRQLIGLQGQLVYSLEFSA